MKSIILAEPVYQSRVLLMWDCEQEDAAREFIRRYQGEGYPGKQMMRDLCACGQDHPHEHDDMARDPSQKDACCYTPTHGHFFGMWLGSEIGDGDDIERLAMIAHECDHIATSLLCNLGIIHQIGDDEPHAYFLQYLVRSVLRAIA